MSIENLREYTRRCATDSELRETAKTIGMMDLQGHMGYAESLGLQWTMEDMDALSKEVTGQSDDGLEDLSEDDLELVAGGAVSVTSLVVAATVAAVAGGVAGASAVVAGKGGW